ncbi:hypothetical protein IAT38_000368 [Cryptococcus sp. DSM 104549]
MAHTPEGPAPLSIPSSSAPSTSPGRPLSDIITVPESWHSASTSTNANSTGRPSVDGEPYQGSMMEPPLPMSASSSSSSSQPIFNWPAPSGSSSRPKPDPFDTFDPLSSSSEEEPVPVYETHRGSHHRSVTDPLLRDGLPVDTEFAGVGGPPMLEYEFQPPPTFARRFSAPLPNRLGYLRHPLSPTFEHLGTVHSPISMTAPHHQPLPPTPLHSVSRELADSLQSAIQTLLHLAPPHLLDNAKEQYSGCTVQIPATSLSALLTSMKGLNFLSAHAEELSESSAGSSISSGPNMRQGEDFDIGELLQSVADMLSGEAAEKKVDFVLFHGDVGIKHVIRQILTVAGKEDTIELGLQVVPQSPSMTPRVGLPLTAAELDRRRGSKSGGTSRSASPGRTSPFISTEHSEGPLVCIFEIVHNIYQAPPGSAAATPKAELNPFTRLAEETEAAKPKLDTIFCRRLLQRQNAVLKVDTQPSSPLGSGLPRRAYELSVLLPRGKAIVEPTVLSADEEASRQPFPSLKLSREPTLNELSEFAESLRGRKVFVHANLSSVFARHLTSYLAAWGMDISHIPTDGDEADRVRAGAAPVRQDSGYGGSGGSSGSSAATPASGEVPQHAAAQAAGSARGRGNFIIVDDDLNVLRRELFRLRAESQPLSLKPRLSKRPTLTGRTRSSPSVRQVAPVRAPSAVLIHFTSLTKYNQVRDAIQGFVGAPWSTGSGAYVQPEVMVIPKPVGPRRFLTALHTAVNQPVVDPFFSPIATSPRSPGGGYFGGLRTPTERETGFFDSVAEESVEELAQPEGSNSQKGRSPLGEFPPSAAQLVQTDHGLHLSLPTPGDIVATPANEYFSSAAKTPSGSSGASGVVMQSPDGRPYGMFFEPPVKNERRGSAHRIPSDTARWKQAVRRASASAGDDVTLSPSAGAPQAPRRSSTMSTFSAAGDHFGNSPGGETRPPAQSRMSSRRRNNNLPATDQPIVAIGRDRSSNATPQGGSKQGTPSGTPLAQSPPGFNVRKSLPGTPSVAGKKAAKADVIVPPINVLIVEDNPINQNILSMFLRKKKIKNQSAKDGAEAVEKWRTGAFHLILMDIQLPVMDGIAATKEIRRLERHNNIGVFPSTPVGEHPTRISTLQQEINATASPFRSSVIIVALTASSLQSDRVAALAAGCNDFLTKPVSLKWLDKKIVEWGCMQALIDFDGWRRWKSVDTNETKRGFTVGPQQAAKSLASRLRIDRKGSRSPAPPSPTAPTAPKLAIQAATPEQQPTPPILAQGEGKPPLESASGGSSGAVSLASIREDGEGGSPPAEIARDNEGKRKGEVEVGPGSEGPVPGHEPRSESSDSNITVMAAPEGSDKPLPPLPSE